MRFMHAWIACIQLVMVVFEGYVTAQEAVGLVHVLTFHSFIYRIQHSCFAFLL
jgi:hypothetical protein